MFVELRIENFGPIGKATIQLGRQGLVYVVGRNDDTSAASSNGSGKSHIWKALSWALFEVTVDGERGDELVHHDADSMSVELDFEADGAIWTIQRGRAKGSPKLALLCEGEELDLPKDEIKARISELVGLDWQGFRNSVLFGQGDIERYANPRTTDATRKDMLHKILGTERLKDAAKWVRTEASKSEKAIAKLEAELRDNRARLEEINLDQLREDRDLFEERRAEKLEAILGRLDRAKKRVDQLTAEADQGRAELSAKIAETEELLAEFGGLDDRERELVAEIEAAEEEARSMGVRADWQRNELGLFKGQLGELAGDTCPTCNGPLSAGPAEALKAELADKVELREKRLASLTRQAEKAKARAKGLRIQLDQVENTKAEVAELVREVERLRAKRAAFDSVDFEAGVEKKRAGEILAEYDAVEAEENVFGAKVIEAEARARKYAKRVSVAEKAIGLRRDELIHLKWWERGFGWKGLPAYMLDAVMPVLTEHANRYLGILADGDLKVEFLSRRELKSGDLRDELSIRIWNEGFEGTRPSGGQQRKIEIATDLALMRVVGLRAGARPGILILDEALDGLDFEGRDRVVKLLQSLTAEIPSIYVIDHWGGAEHAFDEVLVAHKAGGYMSVERGGI